MLFVIVLALVLVSLLIEWGFHLLRDTIDIEWPATTGRNAIDRRARAARMRLWTIMT